MTCSAGANSDRDSLASSGLMEGASGSAVGVDGVQLPRVPFSDWELRPEDIEICTRPDGRQWEIGAGAFGQVKPPAAFPTLGLPQNFLAVPCAEPAP